MYHPRLRSAAISTFHHAGCVEAVRWLNRHAVRILMYHRFADRAALRSQCAHIRRQYQPVSMSAVCDWLRAGRALPRYAVAVTVDDGYHDFLETAYPVFAEYGIPVTVFLVTDFIDGKSWLWFDRVVWAYRHAQVADPMSEGRRMADLAVSLTHTERQDLLERLPRMLEVSLPEQAPPEYQPLSWQEIRTLAASGVEFGAHTRTHPILSALTDPDELRDEIAGSKARIEAELDCPVRHFCYPNGKMADIGAAVIEAVRAAGIETAVTAEPGLNRAGTDAFLLHRVGADFGDQELYFARRLAGI